MYMNVSQIILKIRSILIRYRIVFYLELFLQIQEKVAGKTESIPQVIRMGLREERERNAF